MSQHDAVIHWRLASLGFPKTITSQELADSLSCEGLPYEEIPQIMYDRVVRFRKLRRDERERRCRSKLQRHEGPWLPTPDEPESRRDLLDRLADEIEHSFSGALEIAKRVREWDDPPVPTPDTVADRLTIEVTPGASPETPPTVEGSVSNMAQYKDGRVAMVVTVTGGTRFRLMMDRQSWLRIVANARHFD